MPPGLQSYPGGTDRNHVAVLGGGSARHWFGVNSFDDSGDSRDGFGAANQGITKETEFSLDTRSDDEAKDWFRGEHGRGEQHDFDRV